MCVSALTTSILGAAVVCGVHVHSQNLSSQTCWDGVNTGLTHYRINTHRHTQTHTHTHRHTHTHTDTHTHTHTHSGAQHSCFHIFTKSLPVLYLLCVLLRIHVTPYFMNYAVAS